MSGGKNKQPLGYTIIEVMIVLAISGLMFLIATQFINGKQEKAAFTEGVNDMTSQIQDIVEQVQDGRYSDASLQCDVGYPHVSLGAGGSSDTQGTQSGCVFIGKIVQFNTGGSSYKVFTDVMCRVISPSCGGPANNTGGQVLVIGQNNAPDFTIQADTPQGLTIKSITIVPVPNPGHPLAATLTDANNIGFFQGQGVANAFSGYTDQSGAQNIGLGFGVGANDGVIGSNGQESTANVDIENDGTALASSATICITDGTQYAKLELGGNTGSLSVNVDRVSTC